MRNRILVLTAMVASCAAGWVLGGRERPARAEPFAPTRGTVIEVLYPTGGVVTDLYGNGSQPARKKVRLVVYKKNGEAGDNPTGATPWVVNGYVAVPRE